jgi:excisionase family DNA binding protein
MSTEIFAMGLREAAEAVGLSHWTLRKLIAEGKLPAVRVGRRVLVEPEALRQLVERGRGTCTTFQQP